MNAQTTDVNLVDDTVALGSAIVFADVSKIYPGADKQSVANVSLEVEPGSLVVLLGPSGCGKTTLLKMVNRLIEPTGGQILLDGTDVTNVSAPQLRRQIGYVIQQTGLFPHMRIEENIAVVPKLLGWKRDQIRDRTDELLDLIGLPADEYRRRYPAQLSGGEQQRVGLARALAVNPSMMLMDEPFGALDAITRNRLQGELLRIHQQLGQTILFVTHDIDEAVRLADDIVIMREGSVVQQGAPLDIVTHPVDSFVQDLVGGGDSLRRLSLISVESVAKLSPESPVNEFLTIDRSTDLRQLLDLFLRTGERIAVVQDGDGLAVGHIDMDTLWEVAATEAGNGSLA